MADMKYPLHIGRWLWRRPICYMMIGMSGSGKSTFRKEHLSHVPNVLSMDEIRYAVARAHDVNYRETFTNTKISQYAEMAKNLKLIQLTAMPETKGPFVWDQTNHNSENRRLKIAQLKSCGFYIHAIALVPGMHEGELDRLFSRNQHGVPREKWDAMLQEFELPKMWEGFDKRSIFHVEGL